MRGYRDGGGVIASVVAILGYFRLLGPLSDVFLLYDRARAARSTIRTCSARS